MASSCGETERGRKKESFRWDKDDKIENLIRCLSNYKARMEYINSDFNTDTVKHYEAV